MLILWLQRVFKRADVSENYLQIFSQLWLCRCVMEQTPQGSPKALVEQKQSESIKNWQSHKFFTKNHILVLAKRLRLSETWKHIKNFLGCHFGDLKRKTHRSTSKSSNDKIFQKLIYFQPSDSLLGEYALRRKWGLSIHYWDEWSRKWLRNCVFGHYNHSQTVWESQVGLGGARKKILWVRNGYKWF